MSDPNGAPGAMQSFGGSPAPHPSSLRPEAISSAVAFLSDPKVSNAPLSQRVSFLESKGLSPAEIDASIAQTGAAGARGMAGPTAGPGAYGPAYGPYGINPQAQQQGRDWRDWFIMAVVSGTVGYGLISLARVSKGASCGWAAH
jgi:peroxin-14